MGSCKYDYDVVFDMNIDPNADGDRIGMCIRSAGTPVDDGVGSDVADVATGDAKLAPLRRRSRGRSGMNWPVHETPLKSFMLLLTLDLKASLT